MKGLVLTLIHPFSSEVTRLRLMAVALPFMCLATAAFFLLAIPLAFLVMIVLMVKPGLVSLVQGKAEKKMIHAMFSRMTKGTMSSTRSYK
jgi:hypothetical protein